MSSRVYGGDITSIIGVPVAAKFPCLKCSSLDAVIAEGTTLHASSVRCRCGRFIEWVSWINTDGIIAAVKLFGVPTEPIKISEFGAAFGCDCGIVTIN